MLWDGCERCMCTRAFKYINAELTYDASPVTAMGVLQLLQWVQNQALRALYTSQEFEF